MKTNKATPISKEVLEQVEAVKKTKVHPADLEEITSYKLTLPINKKRSHKFQAMCKDLDTDASKYLRRHIYDCVEAGKLL